MTAIVRTAFRVNVVKKFIESFNSSVNSSGNSLYMGIGRPYSWFHALGQDTSGTPEGDNASLSPRTPKNNLVGDNEDWEDLMTLKRITTSELSHGIRNIKWEANTKYDAYRSDWDGVKLKARASVNGDQPGDKPLDVSESDYYVITADTDVWICISNNPDITGTPGISTVAPTAGTTVVDGAVPAAVYPTATSLVKCSDGYVWKKVCNVTNDEVLKFATSEYFPTKNNPADGSIQDDLQTDSEINAGGIFEMIVKNNRGVLDSGIDAGTYYIENASAGTVQSDGSGTPILKIKGNGTGLTFLLTVIKSGVPLASRVDKIKVVNPGSGYTFARVEVPGSGTTAPEIEFLYTPPRGLGVDPVLDLSAYNLVAYAKWSLDGGGTPDAQIDQAEITVQNDYRKVCLILSPLLSGGGIASNTYVDMSYYVTGSNTFISDDIVEYDNGGKLVRGRVIDSDGDHFRFIKTSTENNSTTFGASGIATDPEVAFGTGAYVVAPGSANAAGTGTATAISEPQVIHGSGDIIYTNYRAAIQRSAGLTEEIKIVVEF